MTTRRDGGPSSQGLRSGTEAVPPHPPPQLTGRPPSVTAELLLSFLFSLSGILEFPSLLPVGGFEVYSSFLY